MRQTSVGEIEEPVIVGSVISLFDQDCQQCPKPRSLRVFWRNKNIQEKAVKQQNFSGDVNFICTLDSG